MGRMRARGNRSHTGALHLAAMLDEPGAEAARAWREARDFSQLCELGARFLEGELPCFPGWGAPEVDQETDALVPLLAAANRAGFLTLASQRGAPASPGADGRTERRRAFVCGFAAEGTAQTLEQLSADGELEVAREGRDLTLGLRGQEPFLVVGADAAARELEIFAEYIHADALSALRNARYVCLADGTWGRDDRLWPKLARALGIAYRGPSHSARPPA